MFLCACAKAIIAAFAIDSTTSLNNSNIKAALATSIKFFDVVEELIYAQSFGIPARQKFRLKVFIIFIIIFNNSAILILPIDKKMMKS